MIYHLPHTDISRVLPLAAKFFAESGEGGTFNPDYFVEWWGKIIESQCGAIIVSERNGEIVGMFGCIADKEYMTGDLVLDEVFWYGDSSLFPYAVKLAKKLDCKRMYISHTNSLTPGRLQQFYVKSGFSHKYTRYVKEL